ncbi:hypothetical protein [Parahaliea mediterranea]|uniref:hypothetical protein n=1 Tax=Parahaliea mediterranea TaxID=651086 RepID=UPI000E2F83F3|nr:hypothetical protein [Parahaliea mediterranea]
MWHWRLPYELRFDGGCLIQRAPTQVLLEFKIQADGRVASVRARPPAPAHDALDALLQAARSFYFRQRIIEWEAQPYTTVVALPLPNDSCWHPPLGDEQGAAFPQGG